MQRLAPPTRTLLAALCAVALAAVAAPVAPAAAKSGIALPGKKIEALIELRHPRGLNRFVRKVSDPSSPRYRRYASVEKLVARYGATPKSRQRVLLWLRARGLRAKAIPGGVYVLATLPANRAARLMPRAASARPGTAAARIGRRVPAALRADVKRISLLGGAAGRRADAVAAAAAPPPSAVASATAKHRYTSILEHSGTASGCAAGSSGGLEVGFEPFTPNQYLTAYGYSALHAQGLEGQGQTIAIVEGGGFKLSDIATFTRCFGSQPPPIKKVLVGRKRAAAEEEPTLDVSMISIAAPKAKKVYAYVGGESYEAIIETAGAALGSPGHRPDVISISYGFCEPYVSGSLIIRQALDNIFAVAAGAGISVLVSAGDQGSSGCRTFTAEGEETALATPAVQLPSSSAYATAVGGTNLALSKQNRIRAQLAWNDSLIQAAGGGGGTSLLYPRTPWWQDGVHLGTGRKVPDIAALADAYPGYAIFCTASECTPGDDPVFGWQSVGGTSAATPLMAAGVALADQYAAQRGQAPLGFLNPLLYDLGAKAKTRGVAFSDVVTGNNDIGRILPPAGGGGRPLGCCSARPGYDRASGWGSLKIPGFAKLAVAAAR